MRDWKRERRERDRYRIRGEQNHICTIEIKLFQLTSYMDVTLII